MITPKNPTFPAVQALHQGKAYALTPLAIPLDISEADALDHIRDWIDFFGAWLAQEDEVQEPPLQWRIIEPVLMDLPYLVVGAVETTRPALQIRLFWEKGNITEIIWNSPRPPKERGNYPSPNPLPKGEGF